MPGIRRRNPGALHSDASRVSRITDDGTAGGFPTAIVEYEYNGQDEVVGTEYLECDVKRERWTGSGLYGALDRFGRVVDDVWVKDLGTDRAIYDVDLVYDRNSNIVRLDDHVHKTKFDAVYTMDNLDRLTDAREGDLNGGSTIATEARQQTWTLEQTGNWELEKLDLNGDGDWGDTDEHQDDRTHNAVNELTARDTDDNGSNNYTLVYDEAGNLIDDSEAYKYEYDCFYRLRRIYDQTDDLVAEYRYNGLGYRIAEHTDTDTDGDVDGSDAWHHFAHDERWRVVAMFINSSTDPEEQYVHHAAGADGFGGASYIDELVLRDRDAVTDINNALDERLYYLQNRHFDVVALVDDTGKQVEMVRYSAYGVPFGLPGGDCDSDGDCDAGDSTDTDQIQTWINGSAYDVRGDMDLNGDVDATDKAVAAAAPFVNRQTGYAYLSGASNRRGVGGMVGDSYGTFRAYSARHRQFVPLLGRWQSRDGLPFVDGPNVYEFAMSSPLIGLDPQGLATRLNAPPSCPRENYTRDWRPLIDSEMGTPNNAFRECGVWQYYLAPAAGPDGPGVGTVRLQSSSRSASVLTCTSFGACHMDSFTSYFKWNGGDTSLSSNADCSSGNPVCRFYFGILYDIEQVGFPNKQQYFKDYWHEANDGTSPVWEPDDAQSSCFDWTNLVGSPTGQSEHLGYVRRPGTQTPCSVPAGVTKEIRVTSRPKSQPDSARIGITLTLKCNPCQ